MQRNDILIELSFEDADDIEITLASNMDTVNEATCFEAAIEKRAKNKFNWETHSEWNSLDDALDFLENEGFVQYDDSDLKCGQTFYFRCKRTPKTMKPYCDSRYILFLPSDRNAIIIQHNGNKHNHNILLEGKKRMLSDEMVAFVCDLFEKEVTKYKQVIKFIEDARAKQGIFEDEPNPDSRQIEYQLKKFRNKDIQPLFQLGDLMSWCNENSVFPSDENEAFVLASECSPLSEDFGFKFCITTPLLLKKFIGLKTICIDATYKLN